MSRIVVTGGTGFLGRGLIRRLLDEGHQVMSLSRTNQKVNRLYAEIGSRPRVTCAMMDVTDREGIEEAVDAWRPETVYHLAAFKYVPEAERNPRHCFTVNVTGTANVLHACGRSGVKKAVLVSSDKANYPISVYGASKLMAEKLWLAGANERKDSVEPVVVRLTNLLGSDGSVLDIWKRQAEQGRALTVTSGEMTRFFVTREHAVDLLYRALEAPVGSIVVPLDWKGVRILDMARVLSDRHGKLPAQGIIGRRPGERDYEVLVREDEMAQGGNPGEVTYDGAPISFAVPYPIIPGDWRSDADLMDLDEIASLLDRWEQEP